MLESQLHLDIVVEVRCIEDQRLHFVGAMFQGRSVSSVGSTRGAALARAVSEAAEILALSATRHETTVQTFPSWHKVRQEVADTAVSKTPVTTFEQQGEILQSAATASVVRSLRATEGCGASNSFEAAGLHGIWELIERDALALWWYEGVPARRLAPRPQEGLELLPDEMLLDLTAQPGLPVVAAVSFDPDGRGFVYGTGARGTVAEAARKAISEMRQMQTGRRIIHEKILRLGPSALRPEDWSALGLADAVCRDGFMKDVVSDAPAIIASTSPSNGGNLESLVDALDIAGVRLALLDLGAHLGRRVAKAVSPDLRPSTPCEEASQLRRARDVSVATAACFRGLAPF